MNASNLGSVVADATMRAAVEILHQRKIDLMGPGGDVEGLCAIMREEAKRALNEILEQGKEMAKTPLIHTGWANELVKTECVAAARRAVDRYTGKESNG